MYYQENEMKKFFVLLVIVFSVMFVSCSKDKSTLKVESGLANAFNTGDNFEVNITGQAKSIKLNEKDGKYSASIFYSIDIIYPDGKTQKSISSQKIDTVFAEKTNDIKIDVQFTLGKDSKLGKYKAVINVRDNLNEAEASSISEFILEE